MFPLALLLSVLGLAGVATLLTLPVPPLSGMADGLANRAILAVQPAILTLVCVALWAYAAPRAGLGAPALSALLQGDSPWPSLRAGLVPAVLVAAASAAVIALYSAMTAPLLAGAGAFEIGFGWLFWRYGLEAAIVAHAGAYGIVYAATLLGKAH